MPRGARKTRSSRKQAKPNKSPLPEVSTDEVQPIYFWKPHEIPYGIFSQWHAEDFNVPNEDGTGTTFGTAEQYMMYRKALLFNDEPTAAEILTTTDPRTQRALGRAVKNFDEGVWCANRSRIVEDGSYWKFKRDPTMLLNTGGRELVEASPMDRIWGIGYGPGKANTRDRHRWGMNLLGKALMEARERIKEEIEIANGNGNLKVEEEEKENANLKAEQEEEENANLKVEQEEEENANLKAEQEEKENANLKAEQEEKENANLKGEQEEKENANLKAEQEEKENANLKAEQEEEENANLKAEQEEEENANLKAEQEEKENANLKVEQEEENGDFKAGQEGKENENLKAEQEGKQNGILRRNKRGSRIAK